MEIYVSTLGNDTSAGTLDAPLLTIQKAIDIANENDTIYLLEGRYFVDKTIELVSKKNITIKANDSTTVYVDGGIVVDNSRVQKLADESIKERIIDKSILDKVYEADLSGLGINFVKYLSRGFSRTYAEGPTELFINAKAQNVTVFPKDDQTPFVQKTIKPGSSADAGDFSMEKPVLAFTNDRCNLWGEANGACIRGLFRWSYAFDTIEVEKFDVESQTIQLAKPHYFGFVDEGFTHWRALNLLEELSAPGEYFIDCITQKLYFIPECDPTNALIEVSSLGAPIFAIEDCEGVTIDGLIIENSRYSGVYMHGGKNNLVSNCTIRNIGTLAVQIGKGVTEMPDGMYSEEYPLDFELEYIPRRVGSFQTMIYHYPALDTDAGVNNGIDHCEIYGIGAGGVLIGGGNRKKLTNANNFVTNCTITDVNRLDKTYKAGIHVYGCGNRIANNEIFNLPGFGLYLHGNNHILEYNDVHHVVTEVADAGAFYMGRDISEVGNILRFNHFHDIDVNVQETHGVCAIYFDDGCCFNTVFANYFTRIRGGRFSTLFWNLGGQSSVSNNVFTECPTPIRPIMYGTDYAYSRLMKPTEILHKRAFVKDDSDLSGVDIQGDVYKNAYPYLYDLSKGEYIPHPMFYNNHLIIDPYKELADYDNGDMSIPLTWGVRHVTDPVLGYKDAEVKYVTIDFHNIGPQK